MSQTPQYKRPVSVLVVIHHRAEQFLLLQRTDNAQFWQSVTGSLEDGETPLQTAVRELGEETGLWLPPERICDWQLSYDYDIFPEYWHRYAPGTRKNTEHVFSVEIEPSQTICIAPYEHTAFRWLDGETAVQWAYSPSNRDAIARLILQDAS